jgi:hypothetical protein
MDLRATNGVQWNDPRREADGTVRFTSKQDYKRWLADHGYEIRDHHVPLQGSDKSPHGKSWATMDPQTLDNARYLVTHRQIIDAEEPDEPLNIRWVDVETGL